MVQASQKSWPSLSSWYLLPSLIGQSRPRPHTHMLFDPRRCNHSCAQSEKSRNPAPRRRKQPRQELPQLRLKFSIPNLNFLLGLGRDPRIINLFLLWMNLVQGYQKKPKLNFRYDCMQWPSIQVVLTSYCQSTPYYTDMEVFQYQPHGRRGYFYTTVSITSCSMRINDSY